MSSPYRSRHLQEVTTHTWSWIDITLLAKAPIPATTTVPVARLRYHLCQKKSVRQAALLVSQIQFKTRSTHTRLGHRPPVWVIPLNTASTGEMEHLLRFQLPQQLRTPGQVLAKNILS